MGNRTKRVRNARRHDRAPPANPDHAGNPSPLRATAASPGPHRHLHLGLVTMAKEAPSRRRHRPPKSPIKYATVELAQADGSNRPLQSGSNACCRQSPRDHSEGRADGACVNRHPIVGPTQFLWCHHAECWRRARRRSIPAAPYICRFSIFSRLIWPSVWPLDQGSRSAAATASRSAESPREKAASPDAFA